MSVDQTTSSSRPARPPPLSTGPAGGVGGGGGAVSEIQMSPHLPAPSGGPQQYRGPFDASSNPPMYAQNIPMYPAPQYSYGIPPTNAPVYQPQYVYAYPPYQGQYQQAQQSGQRPSFTLGQYTDDYGAPRMSPGKGSMTPAEARQSISPRPRNLPPNISSDVQDGPPGVDDPGWRDKCCGIVFIGQALIVIVMGSFYISKGEQGSTQISRYGSFFAMGLVLSALITGLISVLYINLIKYLKGKVVVFSFLLQIGLFLLAGIIGIAYKEPTSAVIGFLMAGISALFLFCVRHRIPFTEAIIHNSILGVFEYWGVFVAAFSIVVASIAWTTFWTFAITYMIGSKQGEEVTKGELGFEVFLLSISLLWTLETLRNIAHTTTAGAVGTWWLVPQMKDGVSGGALKRACTTSLGSIAFGSMLVTLVQVLRALVQNAVRDNRGLIACIALSIMSCIEGLFRLFNKYAFTQVALYGKDFVSAAKDTFNLLEVKGFTLLINDSLSDAVIASGMMITTLISLMVVALPAVVYGKHQFSQKDEFLKLYFLMITFICIMVATTFFAQIDSAVCSTFVIWAEDPEGMRASRTDNFAHIETSRLHYRVSGNN